ncbi:DUF6286 domain-containing protein [Corynebacterium spheniscorum]|uniref:DUF6286 domain-containing protein n=1 Tax=Corynebacterium spheniscorum TaxID=185761 RepID=A0A1I2PIF5_9CORY|nr:DUF6286 domain-containing protein [Corynebacterium spheniscorum]KAA8723768.1 hypothetical protein F4V56_02350 [Corynebacterium spheniscorum]SFG15952.1 hypothetical protein SAMN05660282_00074 [Corynebacterium spheniscorum]
MSEEKTEDITRGIPETIEHESELRTAPAGLDKHLGQEPKASPAARWLVIVLGLLLISLAIVLGRDLWLNGNRPALAVPQVLDLLSNATYEPWMLPAGIVSVVVGVIMVILALKPRKATHHQLRSTVSLWMRPVDIARKATATASRVAGVSTAHSHATKKTVNVSITGDAEDEQLGARVEQAVTGIARELDPAPEVKVRVRPRGEVHS